MESGVLGVVLDSSIVITAERKSLPVPQLIEAIRAAHGEIELAVSPVTIAELVQLLPVHPITLQTAYLVGEIEGQEAARGNVLPFNDLLIAAAAIEQVMRSLRKTCATSKRFPASTC